MVKIYITVIATLFLLANCAGLGMGPLKAELSLSAAPQTENNAYNFVKAVTNCRGGNCEGGSCCDDCAPNYLQTLIWTWSSVPAGARQPATIEVDRGYFPSSMIAFKPEKIGDYTLTATFECKDEEDSINTETRQLTFHVADGSGILSVVSTITEGEANPLLRENRNVNDLIHDKYSYFSEYDFFLWDFDDDEQEDVLLYLKQNADPVEIWKIISINDYGVTTENELAIVPSSEWDFNAKKTILGIFESREGKTNAYVVEMPSYDYSSPSSYNSYPAVVKYLIDTTEHKMELQRKLIYPAGISHVYEPAIDMNGDNIPEFLARSENQLYFLDTILTERENSTQLAEYGKTLMPEHAELIFMRDQDSDGRNELIYSIGSSYFVYEY